MRQDQLNLAINKNLHKLAPEKFRTRDVYDTESMSPIYTSIIITYINVQL